jgi:hypothetical protein
LPRVGQRGLRRGVGLRFRIGEKGFAFGRDACAGFGDIG